MGSGRCCLNASMTSLASNQVCVIDVFVDALSLAEMGFAGAEPAATGRPSYHPSVLLKLYISGYLNRVQSSRRLEREAGRHVEGCWVGLLATTRRLRLRKDDEVTNSGSDRAQLANMAMQARLF
ncbi:protein of unknown function [Bradyrhizobium vignae]|uniref:Transposase InsH N-terminal domain-containing protein n=1 Tax=Bradyrhizobium vignae TaxID=1549949 RepID=A0A2U3Q713_9BRAD|nr:protein of unknown function [Bradyrhizobium vignae]